MSHPTPRAVGREPRARVRACLILGLLALGQGACFASVPGLSRDAPPIGALAFATPALGEQTLAPASCLSGEHQLFLGADFVDPGSGWTARLLLEPTGAASLRVFEAARPLEPGVVFDRHDCSTFQLSLERTGWQIDEIYDLRVSLDVDCRNAAGDSAKGRLAVDHCH